jgi:hypothetical protein
VVKMSDSTVADSKAAAGGAMEIKEATVDCERCTLTRLQAHSSLATCLLRHHLSHRCHYHHLSISTQATSLGMVLSGGGFFVGGGGKLNVVDSNISHVVGSMIGGIFALNGGSLDILRCYFETASAMFMGALIAGSGTTVVITMRDSVARDMGNRGGWSWNALTLFDGPTATVSNCRFEACEKGIFYLGLVPPPIPLPHTHDHQPVPRCSPHGLGLPLIMCPPPRLRRLPSSTTATSRTLRKTGAPWRPSGRVPSLASPARLSSAAPLTIQCGAPTANALSFSSMMPTK